MSGRCGTGAFILFSEACAPTVLPQYDNEEKTASRKLHVNIAVRRVLPENHSSCYLPLKSESSFRVLKIEPGAPGTALCCRLKEFPSPLLETARYEALSYAWSDEMSSACIYMTDSNDSINDYPEF